MRIAAIDPGPLVWKIHGDPLPQARGRGRVLPSGRATVYVPASKWRKQVRRGLEVLDVPHYAKGIPVSVALVFRLTRPKSHYGTGRNAGKLKPSAPQYPLAGKTGAKPQGGIGDLDNYAKAVLDEMNGICFHDDAQVVELSVTKLYADYGPPGVSISYQRTNMAGGPLLDE